MDVGLDQLLANEDLSGQQLLVRHIGDVVAERGEGAACAPGVLRCGANEDVDVERRPVERLRW